MSLQKFVNSAQNIEFARADVVATSVSRSGRVITQTRNTVRPWTFKIVPPQVMSWALHRSAVEQLLTNDRHTEHELMLGQTPGATWLTQYQGNAPRTGSVLDSITVTATANNTITINVTDVAVGTRIFEPGDLVQLAGVGSDSREYRYPYAVRSQVIRAAGVNSVVVPLHRGFISQPGYNPVSSSTNQNRLRVGTGVKWRVLLQGVPTVRYLPGQLMEFGGTLDLLEFVE